MADADTRKVGHSIIKEMFKDNNTLSLLGICFQIAG